MSQELARKGPTIRRSALAQPVGKDLPGTRLASMGELALSHSCRFVSIRGQDFFED